MGADYRHGLRRLGTLLRNDLSVLFTVVVDLGKNFSSMTSLADLYQSKIPRALFPSSMYESLLKAMRAF